MGENSHTGAGNGGWELGIVCRDPEGKGTGIKHRERDKDRTLGKGKGTRIRHWEWEQGSGTGKGAGIGHQERDGDQADPKGWRGRDPQKQGLGRGLGSFPSVPVPPRPGTLQTRSGAVGGASQTPRPSQLEGALRSLTRDQQHFGAEQSGLDPQNVGSDQ